MFALLRGVDDEKGNGDSVVCVDGAASNTAEFVALGDCRSSWSSEFDRKEEFENIGLAYDDLL
jgi:hypothetical protein